MTVNNWTKGDLWQRFFHEWCSIFEWITNVEDQQHIHNIQIKRWNIIYTDIIMLAALMCVIHISYLAVFISLWWMIKSGHFIKTRSTNNSGICKMLLVAVAKADLWLKNDLYIWWIWERDLYKHLSRYLSDPELLPITINGCFLGKVFCHERLLGINNLDLKWRQYIRPIAKDARKRVGFLYRTSK